MTNLPTLDAPRTATNAELNRQVLDTLGHIEPYIDETDSCIAMPLRLSHNEAAGICIEIGPYDLDHHCIEQLRHAIHAYDLATHGPTLRRIK